VADSRADRAGRIAAHALNRLTRNEQNATDALISTEVQNAIKKQRAEINEVLTIFGTTEPGYATNIIDQGYDLRQYYGQGADLIEPDMPDLHAPVSFSGPNVEAPTATSKIDRPRTFAAAYDPQRSTMTIVFSTGVIYNYYDVSMDEWVEFKNLPSKWEYIKDVLDSKPRGYASRAEVSPQLQAFAARAYRAAQIAKNTRRKK